MVIVTAALRAWATTGAQMFTESLQIDVARQSSALRQDMAEVRRRPHVSNRRVVGIALALKRRGEAIEVQPTRPACADGPASSMPGSSSPT